MGFRISGVPPDQGEALVFGADRLFVELKAKPRSRRKFPASDQKVLLGIRKEPCAALCGGHTRIRNWRSRIPINPMMPSIRPQTKSVLAESVGNSVDAAPPRATSTFAARTANGAAPGDST